MQTSNAKHGIVVSAALLAASLGFPGCGGSNARYQGTLTVTGSHHSDVGTSDPVTSHIPTVVRQTDDGYLFEAQGACDGLLFKTKSLSEASIVMESRCSNYPKVVPTRGTLTIGTNGVLNVEAHFDYSDDADSQLVIFGMLTLIKE